MTGPTSSNRTIPNAPAASVSSPAAQALRESFACVLWIALGGFLYAAGLLEPERASLLWGGALSLTWGMTRGVFALGLFFSAARRGS